MPKQVFGLKEPTEHLTFAEYPTKKFPRLLGQFEEWANSARDQSLSLNELKSVVTKYYEIVEIEYSTRDCFESKGEYMRVLNIGLSLLDLCKADLLDVDHKVFDYANSKLLSRLKVWTSSLVNKVVPRPSNLGQYSQFVELLNHYHEWISSIPLQNGFPDADVLTLNGFGENTLELVNQVIDITISTASRIKDHYLLSRDRQRYLNDFRLMISRGGTRLRRHLGCMRIMRYYISTVTELTTDTDDDLKLFIEYLSTSEKFVQLRGEQGNILEYVTRSLIDDQKKFRLFKLAKCDRSYIFSNELSIKIDPSSRAIEVDSRNVWERDAWFWDVMRMFNLKIVVRRSLEASFNEWISKIQERFEIMILCSMWALKSYSEEDMIREDPMFMLQQYYHCCDLAIIMLRLSEGALTIYTRAVWNCFSRVIAGWIEQLNMIISHDLLPDTSDYVLSILNFHVQCVVGCPDPSLIERTLLITALQKLGETLEKVNDNEHSRLARFYTGRCITMLLDKSYLRQDEDKTGLMFLSVIGNGTTGIVYKCFDPTINMTIALKEVHYSGSDDGLVNEIKYLRFLHHRNVVSLHDALVTNDKFFIKMELCLGGTLLNLINSKRPVDDELFRKVAVEICLGLAYLHMNHIVHGDLKPSNILISQFGAIKLADFGTAHRAATTTRSKGALQLGTIQYMSPETILNGRVGLEADLWSLGCTLFHFATGCVPYAECDSPWQVLKKMSDKQLFDITPLRSAKLDPQAIAIIESCLDFDVTKRPVMTQLCLLDYFYDIHSSTN